MTHTPGPWEQRDTPGYNDTEIWAGNMLVAKVRDGDHDGPLVAAAPELLTELQELVETFKGYQGTEMTRARAVIAKALGNV